jgi:hypothetical protein
LIVSGLALGAALIVGNAIAQNTNAQNTNAGADDTVRRIIGRPASGSVKAASKGRTTLARVDGRHVAKHASRADNPVAVVDHQAAIKSVLPEAPH